MTGRPLFEDRIEAWQRGLVVPAVIHASGEWGDAKITAPTEQTGVKPEVARLIDSVAEEYDSLPETCHAPSRCWRPPDEDH